ncbi:hypothetical protein NQ315_006861 [Exocentrus adspersus]|uniref:Uncharacterized protein n=1 Tax=Exocentrus adspersus TaxID=1586481 RepID=A0AAV8WDG6_9CUCU|nr:hypothetical protein NQ315_006861 [Exocentrus adspersus]
MKASSAAKNKTEDERKSVVYVILILISVCLLAAVIVIWKLKTFSSENVCSSVDCLHTSSYLLDLLEAELPPCDNFYNFTCGNYKGHLLVHNLQNEIDLKLHQFITGPILDDDWRSVKLQKRYYHACMNVTRIEEDQNEALKKLYEQLGGWPVLKGTKWKRDSFDWGRIVEKCKDLGFYYDWFINVQNGDEDVDENRLYVTFPDGVNRIEKTLTKKYVALMTNGAPGTPLNISASMKRVMEFEIGLEKIIRESQINQTMQEYTVEELKFKYPSVPWSLLLKYVILPRGEKLVFSLDKYIPKLQSYLNSTDKRVQADYIFWKLTESFSGLLTYVIRKEFETYTNFSKSYHFTKDRESYCYGITSTVFAYVSEAEFVRRHTIEKESIREMVDRIKLVLRKHIEDITWLTEDVKNVVYDKIKNITTVIGGPDEMYDEEEFDKFLGIDQINLSGLNNTIEIVAAVDKSRDVFNLDFSRPKLTLKKAQLYQGVANLGFIKYIPDENLMFLPAAALGGIFYSPTRVNYLNYGAIGTIIGHELAHGFGLLSNLGIDPDETNLTWRNDTLERFLESAKCLLEDCNNIGVENNINMLCRETFEENFADYAGINLSYEAYLNWQEENGKESNLIGLNYTSNQLFWIMYASLMCNNVDVDDREGLIHMLPFQRILGAFRNSKHFAKDFECVVGSNMNPEVKCKIL